MIFIPASTEVTAGHEMLCQRLFSIGILIIFRASLVVNVRRFEEVNDLLLGVHPWRS